LAQDDIDVHQPQGAQGLALGARLEGRERRQGPDEASTQGLVGSQDEDSMHTTTADTTCAAGNSTVKIAPPPGRLPARRRAPWAWAMPAEIANPRPEPRALVVKNGSNTRSSSSGG